MPQASGMAGMPPLGLVAALCRALEAQGIAYCHWKSSAALDRSASGLNDLDLLIGPDDAAPFADTLHQLGFKLVRPPHDRRMPGVQDYYGYDSDSGRLVHVHAHHLLIVGHDATKNYHLPIEVPYLESAVQAGLFRVPAPEFELAVFVIRMVLKHSTWDAILCRQGALSASERSELAHLEGRVAWARVRSVVSQHLPAVDAALLNDCRWSLQPGCPLWVRVRAGRRLEHALRTWARRPPLADVCLKVWRQLAWAFRRRALGRVRKGSRDGGGLMIGIVGGDGAGKTTAVDGLSAWLSGPFDVARVHLGKPPWSPVTVAVHAVLKLGTSLGLYPFMRAPINLAAGRAAAVFPGYPSLLRAVCTARDRYLAYEKARRSSAAGAVVLCDRYPLPHILPMDGPLVRRLTSKGPHNALVRLLERLEKRYYEAILSPQLLLVLLVDPATAAQRKIDEDPDTVRARCQVVWQCDWEQVGAQVVDAGRPRELVLAELKAAIWSRL